MEEDCPAEPASWGCGQPEAGVQAGQEGLTCLLLAQPAAPSSKHPSQLQGGWSRGWKPIPYHVSRKELIASGGSCA